MYDPKPLNTEGGNRTGISMSTRPGVNHSAKATLRPPTLAGSHVGTRTEELGVGGAESATTGNAATLNLRVLNQAAPSRDKTHRPLCGSACVHLGATTDRSRPAARSVTEAAVKGRRGRECCVW